MTSVAPAAQTRGTGTVGAAAAYVRNTTADAARTDATDRFGAASVVKIGSAARQRAATLLEQPIAGSQTAPAQPDATGAPDAPTWSRPESGDTLSAAQEREVQKLKTRDAEVRTHEQAHKSAAGGYAGAIHLEYDSGPDGKRYAVAGHVPIDVSPVAEDPQATIAKMNVVRRAALAPAEPSGADRQVAAKASAHANQARAELAEQRLEQNAEKTGTPPESPTEATDP